MPKCETLCSKGFYKFKQHVRWTPGSQLGSRWHPAYWEPLDPHWCPFCLLSTCCWFLVSVLAISPSFPRLRKTHTSCSPTAGLASIFNYVHLWGMSMNMDYETRKGTMRGEKRSGFQFCLLLIIIIITCVCVSYLLYIYPSTMGSRASYSNEVCRGCSFASLAIILTWKRSLLDKEHKSG